MRELNPMMNKTEKNFVKKAILRVFSSFHQLVNSATAKKKRKLLCLRLTCASKCLLPLFGKKPGIFIEFLSLSLPARFDQKKTRRLMSSSVPRANN